MKRRRAAVMGKGNERRKEAEKNDVSQVENGDEWPQESTKSP